MVPKYYFFLHKNSQMCLAPEKVKVKNNDLEGSWIFYCTYHHCFHNNDTIVLLYCLSYREVGAAARCSDIGSRLSGSTYLLVPTGYDM